jgi:hypothetical protein
LERCGAARKRYAHKAPRGAAHRRIAVIVDIERATFTHE